jgi:hypothetical protein
MTPLQLLLHQAWPIHIRRQLKKKLHRLIHPAAAACLHFIWKAKVTEPEPYL